jgi:hypothetical protein
VLINKQPPRDNEVRAAWLVTLITLVMLLSITVGLRFVVIDPDRKVAMGYLIGVATGATCSLVGGFVATLCYRK